MNPAIHGILLAGALLIAPAGAQDYLHFKFDDGCQGKAINYAAGSPAPREGTLVTNLTGGLPAAWKPGVWGGALTGGTLTTTPQEYNYIDTGWNPGAIAGSLSFSFWLRMNPAAPTPSLTYLFGNGANFRVFTGGGGFFLTSGWGGSNVNTVANIQTLAKAGWVHLALVIDATALRATYYINNVPENPVTITSGANFTGAAFYVGKYSGLTNANIFDLDEFLLTGRALSAAEIAKLAASPPAASGAYGAGGCGGYTLGSAGGPPALGSATFALTLNSANAAAYAVAFGRNRCAIGTVPLPFDLGLLDPRLARCLIEASLDLASLGGGKPPGAIQIPLPIPPIAVLAGANLFLQTIAFDGGTGLLTLSNAFSIGLGH